MSCTSCKTQNGTGAKNKSSDSPAEQVPGCGVDTVAGGTRALGSAGHARVLFCPVHARCELLGSGLSRLATELGSHLWGNGSSPLTKQRRAQSILEIEEWRWASNPAPCRGFLPDPGRISSEIDPRPFASSR